MTAGMRFAAFGGGTAEEGFVRTTGTVTLATSGTTTTHKHYGCSAGSVIILVPIGSTSAAALAAGNIYVTPAKGEFTVTHPVSASTRTFKYVFFQGA